MCGIAGVFDASARAVDRELIAAMSSRLAHRGPDEEGFLFEAGAGLASRRLRIIDLEGGRQPIFNEDKSIGVVFNGEIYNFQELRRDLIQRGHTFSTRADTEVLVHLYEDFGFEFLEPLRGMFALALWDAPRRIGILARDRLGKKPLVYTQASGSLYFASEIQGLLPIPGFSREVDSAAIGDYLEYGYIPAPATIFKEVRKLPPAHLLVWQGGEISLRRYWNLEYTPKLQLDEHEALEQLEQQLDEAVRLRLIADVPLGALLSGGVDSSTVVALMARYSGRVKTFSIGFDEPAFDELAHARRVAEHYNTDHHELVVQPETTEVLPLLARHYGEPYADSSALPTFYVTQLARQHVTVALNGDGGDESFAGYDRYRAAALSQSLGAIPAAPALALLADTVVGCCPGVKPSLQRRAHSFLQPIGLPLEERYARWATLLRPPLIGNILTPEVAQIWWRSRSTVIERELRQRSSLDLPDRVMATDVASYLPFDLLVKMDIASMANSLETRSPLLDHKVMEFAAHLPGHLKLKHAWSQKYLLKKLARKLIPAENIDRPKMGFGVPVGSWLRGTLRPLAHEALLVTGARRGFFSPPAIERLWADHQTQARDHTHVLWSLLMFELWCREFLDAPSPSSRSAGLALANPGGR